MAEQSGPSARASTHIFKRLPAVLVLSGCIFVFHVPTQANQETARPAIWNAYNWLAENTMRTLFAGQLPHQAAGTAAGSDHSYLKGVELDWKKLLSTKRLGRESEKQDNAPPPRTEFTRDYDRIIFSSAFRRLQDKTQVFPLAKSDYVRTRLTHSLEVASVGRSLGMLAAEVIRQKEQPSADSIVSHDIGTIVSAACLAHDIGNPPFGHAGELAIQDWFKTWGTNGAPNMNGAEWSDLLKFEGNAQGFRTLCSLQNSPQRGGLQLTCAVLGAFTKYPRASRVDEGQARGISGKKFGFMQSEADLFQELADELGLVRKPGAALAWYRHPLAFLVEAADDICYHVMDIEDGYKTGHITYDELANLHFPWLTCKQKQRGEAIEDTGKRVEYFRAVTVDKMVRETVEVFESKYEDLLNGSFDNELPGQLSRAKEFKAFKTAATDKVYCARPVVEIETCGFEVIAGLLSSFVSAIEDEATNANTAKARSRTLLRLLPGGGSNLGAMCPYKRTLKATDFIAGMTDSFALELYRRIRGITLP